MADNRRMKNLALSLLVFLVLAVAAIALARVTQILAPHVGWPLLVVLAGGGLGTAALFLWQQQLVRSWPLFLVMTLLAGVLMAAAGHFFDWREAVAASQTRRAEAIAKKPRYAALIDEQIPDPTWSEFMQPTTDAGSTWAVWLGDAAAKLVLALAILIVGKRNGWLAAGVERGSSE
jgi:hypothetical protein